MSGRCKCCDRVLKRSEIVWIAEDRRHEDLCCQCRWNVHNDLLGLGYDKDDILLDENSDGRETK